MTTETGGPAFPCHPGIENPLYDGMTLRDYFAAKAMEALVHNRTPWDAAAEAYAYADAMLKARKA
jgi:hypothetical protein